MKRAEIAAFVAFLFGLLLGAAYAWAHKEAEIERRWPDAATRANCSGGARWVCVSYEPRMVKVPCAPGAGCKEVVYDSVWHQIVEVKQ